MRDARNCPKNERRQVIGLTLSSTMGNMLVLFDIDGTLLRSNAVGLRAMTLAIQEVHGENVTFDGIDFAGNLDPLIYRDALRTVDLPYDDEQHDRFRTRYRKHLTDLINDEQPVYALPGVPELLAALGQQPHITIGLLTGNYPETGRIKIAGAGIEPDQFVLGAFGCDGPTRCDLPPIAMDHYHHHHGRPVPAAHTLIIGDTRHDIACAQAHNCRSLAVATGYTSRSDLLLHKPDRAADDLRETTRLVDWILSLADVKMPRSGVPHNRA